MISQIIGNREDKFKVLLQEDLQNQQTQRLMPVAYPQNMKQYSIEIQLNQLLVTPHKDLLLMMTYHQVHVHIAQIQVFPWKVQLLLSLKRAQVDLLPNQEESHLISIT